MKPGLIKQLMLEDDGPQLTFAPTGVAVLCIAETDVFLPGASETDYYRPGAAETDIRCD